MRGILRADSCIDGNREEEAMNVFNLSFGKDSMATLILAAEQGIPTVVEYYADKWNYPAFDLKDHNYASNGLQCAHEEGGCEVIGNIHDNPELLEVMR